MRSRALLILASAFALLLAGALLERGGVPGAVVRALRGLFGGTDRSANVDTAAAEAELLRSVIATLGEPATVDRRGPFVYTTPPERGTTHGPGIVENRNFDHMRLIADHLVSDERKAEAQKRRDAFWTPPGDPTPAWLDSRRDALRRMIGLVDRPTAGAALVDEAIETAEIPTRRLELASRIDGIPVPLIRADPPAGRTPRAVVLALHGASSVPEKVVGVEAEDYTRGFGVDLARAGFTVLAPHVLNVADRYGHVSALGMLYAGTTHFAVDLQKLMAVVDHVADDEQLAGLPITVYGVSYGGDLALMLGALDTRIDAVVAGGIVGDDATFWADWFDVADEQRRFSHVIFNGPFQSLFSHADLARLIVPRPLVLELGSGNLTPGSVDEWHAIREVYRARDAATLTRLAWFDGRHETAAPLTIPLLDQLLGLGLDLSSSPDGRVDPPE